MKPISYAIVPGTDNAILLGLPTIGDLGVDPYARLLGVMRPQMTPSPSVETPAFLSSRRVSLSVDAFQEAGGQVNEERDEAVERLGERDPRDVYGPGGRGVRSEGRAGRERDRRCDARPQRF